MLIPAFLFGKDPLNTGDTAPALQVTTHTGEMIDLEVVYKQGPALVYFYPKADTPGCTKQACNLRDNFQQLENEDITVLGVSMDDVDSQRAFREKYELPFTLIADADKKLGKAFGVGSYGGGAYKRQSFLVKNGKIVWRDLQAKPGTQTSDALAAFRELE